MMTMDFVCVCVCVCVWVSNKYLTLDNPLPLRKSIIGLLCCFTCMPVCDLLSNGGRPQPWTSMVGVCPRLHSELSDVCAWLEVLTNAQTCHTQTHTHTHTHTHTQCGPTRHYHTSYKRSKGSVNLNYFSQTCRLSF